MKSRIPFTVVLAVAISIGAGFARIPAKAYEDLRRGRGARKSSGGRGARRINSPEYSAWRKLFGGVAVPKFFDLSGVNDKRHAASARGPRPETFHKRRRIALHLT